MRDIHDLFQARSLSDLSRRHRLILLYAVGLVAIILFYTAVYNWGMRTLEGEDHSMFRSFQTVVETMTTTGYGADSPWSTPAMNLLVVGMQLSGIAIGFFTLRVLIIPLFKRTPVRLEQRLTPKSDHVVVCEYRRDSGVLLDELQRFDVDYVLIDSDREEAQRLSDAGYQAIGGDPESVETLERASVDTAALLVTDAGTRNASIALTALELNEDLRTVSLTESPSQTRALQQVGVDTVVSPHALIGRRLAHKATDSVTVPEGVSIGDEFEVRELLIRRDSPLHGVPVGETPFVDSPEVTLVAGWFDGDLRLPPAPTDRLTPNTVLVVAGPASALDGAHEGVAGVHSAGGHSNVIVAGFGEGGRAAVDALPDDVSVTTVDASAETEPDVAGDVGDPETLVTAGVEQATALIVTVDDDATALLAVAVSRSLTDRIEILARVTDADKERNAFTAGTDYVLSIQRATSRLLAREIRGENVVFPLSRIRLVRTSGGRFAGRSVGDLNGETDSGWVVVGVEREGTVETDARTVVDDGDTVLVAGMDERVAELRETTSAP